MKYNFPNKHQIKNVQRLVVGFLLITSLFTIVAPLASAGHHTATVAFNVASYDYDSFPIITVTDLDAAGFGTVEVTVTSSIDPVGTTLVLPETSPGVFENSGGELLFMSGDNKVPLETTGTIRFTDPTSSSGPYNLASPDIVGVVIVASEGSAIIPFELTETGDDTKVFDGTLTFSADPTSSNVIQVSAGETFSVLFPCGGAAHGQITPIPASGPIGAVRADVTNTITVDYTSTIDGDTDTDTATLITAFSPCGGGGGGLIIITVVQALLGIGGGGGLDKTPPSLTRPISSGVLFDPFKPIQPSTTQQAPLRINENDYPLYGYSNTIVTNTIDTGQFIDMSLTFEEASKVSHVAMYFVDQGRDENTDRDPALIFDNGNIVKVDPEGIFGDDIQLSTSKEGTKSTFNFGASFDKPTNKNLIIVTWDDKRNSAKTKIFNALQIVGNAIPAEAGHFLPIEELGEYDLIKNDNGQYVLSEPVETKTVTNSPKTIVYPEFIGKLERHDDRFEANIVMETIKAQTISQELIGNPFVVLEDRLEHVKFFYPSNVGKSDRENKEMLKDVMIKEQVKATKICNKLYRTNHLED